MEQSLLTTSWPGSLQSLVRSRTLAATDRRNPHVHRIQRPPDRGDGLARPGHRPAGRFGGARHRCRPGHRSSRRRGLRRRRRSRRARGPLGRRTGRDGRAHRSRRRNGGMRPSPTSPTARVWPPRSPTFGGCSGRSTSSSTTPASSGRSGPLWELDARRVVDDDGGQRARHRAVLAARPAGDGARPVGVASSTSAAKPVPTAGRSHRAIRSRRPPSSSSPRTSPWRRAVTASACSACTPGLLPIGMSRPSPRTTTADPARGPHPGVGPQRACRGSGRGPGRAVDLIVRLAAGDGDSLSGRHLSVHDDLDAVLARLDEVRARDLYVMRADRLPAVASAADRTRQHHITRRPVHAPQHHPHHPIRRYTRLLPGPLGRGLADSSPEPDPARALGARPSVDRTNGHVDVAGHPGALS